MKSIVLEIIDKHQLHPSHIGRLAGLNAWQVSQYLAGEKIGKWKEEWIEKAVIDWRDELYIKRRMLLQNTRYADVYKLVAKND